MLDNLLCWSTVVSESMDLMLYTRGKLLHGWGKLLHGWGKLLHGWGKLLHGWGKLLHGWGKLLHGWGQLVSCITSTVFIVQYLQRTHCQVIHTVMCSNLSHDHIYDVLLFPQFYKSEVILHLL